MLSVCVNTADYKLWNRNHLYLSVCRVFGTAGSRSQLAFNKNTVEGMYRIKDESEWFSASLPPEGNNLNTCAYKIDEQQNFSLF